MSFTVYRDNDPLQSPDMGQSWSLGLTPLSELNVNPLSTTVIVAFTLIAFHFFGGQSYLNCNDTSAGRQVIHSMLHGNLFHLFVNILTFIQLYRLEQMLGARNYFVLIIIILILSSLLYWVLNKFLYGSEVVCSVGFSGVLFGLLVWSRMMLGGGSFDLKELALWFAVLVIPVLQNPQISLLGHLSGLIVGVLLWPILSPILL
jgi:membrane associated rhomboid family serine protease